MGSFCLVLTPMDIFLCNSCLLNCFWFFPCFWVSLAFWHLTISSNSSTNISYMAFLSRNVTLPHLNFIQNIRHISLCLGNANHHYFTNSFLYEIILIYTAFRYFHFMFAFFCRKEKALYKLLVYYRTISISFT